MTIWIPDILDHKQDFSAQFSDHHLNTRPFDNWTQFYHLYTRLVQYSDGYCIQMVKVCEVAERLVFMPFQFRGAFSKKWLKNWLFCPFSNGIQSSLHWVKFVLFVSIFLHWSMFRLYLLIPLMSKVIVSYFSMLIGAAIYYHSKYKLCRNIKYVFPLKIQIVSKHKIWILTQNTNCVATMVVLLIVDIYDFYLSIVTKQWRR